MARTLEKSCLSAMAVAALVGSPALAVDDCCSALTTTNSFRNKVLGNNWCASNWVSTQRHDGKVCLPIGTGYACGSQRTLEVGEEYTLSGDISVGGGGGGASIGASTTFKVSEQTTHTAGNCESCQFFASYGNATLREWDVSSFYVIGADTQKKRITLQKRGAPTIMPCCETNNNCSGCPEGESDGSWAAFMEPVAMDLDGGGEGSPGEITYIVDLRNPEFYSGKWPAWHPMNTPGTTFATLNCWQVWEIIREMMWMSMIEPAPITELAIIDTDGSPFVFDLMDDPGPFGGCPADLDCNGIHDLLDIGLFIDYFLFGDPTVDYDFNGFLDLIDLSTFAGAFLGGC